MCDRLTKIEEFFSKIKIGTKFATRELQEKLDQYGVTSFQPTDYCYNSYCINSQWDKQRTFFLEKIQNSKYIVIGKNSETYSNVVICSSRNKDKDGIVYGKWQNGEFYEYDENLSVSVILTKYLEEFSKVADIEMDSHKECFKSYDFFNNFLLKEKIDSYVWEDFQKIGDNLNTLKCNNQTKKRAFGRPNHEIEEYKRKFKSLLDDSKPLEERVKNFLKDNFKYLDTAITELIGYRFLENYIIRNSITDIALNYIGINTNKDYIALNSHLKDEVKIQELYEKIVGRKQQDYPINIEIDRFFYWIVTNNPPILSKDLISKKSVNIKEQKKNEEEMPQQPKNQILYGPPGTGKTYKINQIIENVIYPQLEIPSINEESNLFSLLDDESFINMKWWIKIATAFYIHNKKKHYLTHKEIVNLKFLQQWYKKSDDYKNLKTFSRSVSSELQKCSNRVGTEQQYKRHKFDYFEEKDNKYKLTNEGESELKQQLKNVGIEIDNQIEQNISTQKTKKELSKEYYTFCTFHQSYSYEEFVEGIKPHLPQNTPESNENNNKLTYQHNCGVFKSICIKARKEPDKKFIIFIDEINRGNISKIFGELITLIEEDKRENINNSCGMYNTIEVTLPYTHEKFSVPNNLYIIGTMNTSDRSIASVDIALRRRFKFKEMMPKSKLVADFDCNFKEVFELLNKRISVLLDRDHQIGHSYFIQKDDKDLNINDLKEIWFDSILPLLNEYFYGDWEKLQKLLGCAKNDSTSFITKLDEIQFADDTKLDEEENCFDFTDKENINFSEAMKHAFKDVFKVEEKND